MHKYRIILAIMVILCFFVIGLNLYKQNQNPIFEMYVAVDTNVPYIDIPSCYAKSWYATLERIDNQHYCLKITQGKVSETDDFQNYKRGLKFVPLKETETSILSNSEYEKFKCEFDYIQKNYKKRLNDKMYDGFYEGTRWYIYIKGKNYSSASVKKSDKRHNDLMEDKRVNRDFFGLFNSYMDNPPLAKPFSSE